MKSIWILTLFIFLTQHSNISNACSTIQLCSKDTCAMGYSMEWVDWSSMADPSPAISKYLVGGLFTQNSGINKISALGKNSLRWTSKFKSLVVSEFGPHMGFNGVNEAGLEVYLLGPPSLTRDSRQLPQVSELDLLPLLLDTAKDVAEALQILDSVSVQQLLFPIQLFIKDSNNKTAIVDFKDGIRVHKPAQGKEFVTNIWYDLEMILLKDKLPYGMDYRHLNLADVKTLKQFDSALAKVGAPGYTQWQTLTNRTKNSWTMRLAILPIDNSIYGHEMNLESSNLIDLNRFFKNENFPNSDQFVFLQEITKGKPLVWRPLTSEDLRLFQFANFQVVQQNQEKLFDRNEDQIDASKKTLARMLQQLKTKPIEF